MMFAAMPHARLIPPPERGRVASRVSGEPGGGQCDPQATPTRLAEFIIGPRFARTRWLGFPPPCRGREKKG
jgi:hypothetical protein